MGPHPQPLVGRKLEPVDDPGEGLEAVFDVFGDEAEFDTSKVMSCCV